MLGTEHTRHMQYRFHAGDISSAAPNACRGARARSRTGGAGAPGPAAPAIIAACTSDKGVVGRAWLMPLAAVSSSSRKLGAAILPQWPLDTLGSQGIGGTQQVDRSQRELPFAIRVRRAHGNCGKGYGG